MIFYFNPHLSGFHYLPAMLLMTLIICSNVHLGSYISIAYFLSSSFTDLWFSGWVKISCYFQFVFRENVCPGSVQGYQTCAKIALFGRCLRHYCIVEVKTPSCFRFLLFQPKYLYNCPIMKVKTPFCSQSFQCSSPQLIGSFPCYSISTMHLFVIWCWLCAAIWDWTMVL
jgi:hypothetical protein